MSLPLVYPNRHRRIPEGWKQLTTHLPRKLVRAVRIRAVELNIPLQQFIQQACREKLQREGR